MFIDDESFFYCFSCSKKLKEKSLGFLYCLNCRKTFLPYQDKDGNQCLKDLGEMKKIFQDYYNINWIPVEDDYEIIGYNWVCPICNHLEYFGPCHKDIVECENCHKQFKNLHKPVDC